MTLSNTSRKKIEVPDTARHLIGLMVALVVVFVLTVCLCLYFSSGFTIAFSLAATCVGALIGVLMLNFQFSDSITRKLGVIGIVLTLAGYAFALRGAFFPVSDVVLPTDQTFDVRTEADACKFFIKTAKLVCPVSVTSTK